MNRLITIVRYVQVKSPNHTKTSPIIAVGFVEHGITAKHLNLTRKQFDEYHQNISKPPLALMESTFSSGGKIGNIFTKNDDGSFDSPALQKIR